MTTNEILLIVGAILFVVLLQLTLRKLPNKTQLFIRLSAGILLLILVWGFGSNVNKGAKIILTVIALSSIVKDVKKQFLSKEKA